MDGALKGRRRSTGRTAGGRRSGPGRGTRCRAGSRPGRGRWSRRSRTRTGRTRPATRRAIGAGKVSHIWGLRAGGQRLTFWDPWLALDESYEMCGPHRGRFRAVNLSASGSFVFVVGRHGDLFTRLYDFDISGHDPVFFKYSYEDQRGQGGGGADPAARRSPGSSSRRSPGGSPTRSRSTRGRGHGPPHPAGRGPKRRRDRLLGARRRGAARRRAGHSTPTGEPLAGQQLRNPARDTSARGLGPGEDLRFRMRPTA